MNRHYKYKFTIEGWQSWALIIFAGVGLIHVCQELAKLIAPLIF